MTTEGHPSGRYHRGTYPLTKSCNDEDREALQYSNSGRRASWRSSDIEATFSIPRNMICPLHGGRYIDSRGGLPPPPPQLAAVATHRRRSRNKSVSTTNERHRGEWDEPFKAHYPAAEAFTNQHLTDERVFPPGYGWAEPGKGWTRCSTRTRPNRRPPDQGGSCRAPPDSLKDFRTSTVTGNDSSRSGVDRPTSRDAIWAMSYLAREDEASWQRRIVRNVTKDKAKSQGCHQQEFVSGPPKGVKGSVASRRQNAAQLAETHVMKNVSYYRSGSRTHDQRQCHGTALSWVSAQTHYLLW